MVIHYLLLSSVMLIVFICLRFNKKLIFYSQTDSELSKIVFDKTVFSLHSVRSGVTTAAASFEVNDRLFQEHDRWRSENVKIGNVYEDLRTLLSVSKNLGF